jgi:hypothetical protein
MADNTSNSRADRRGIEFLPDYCPRCNPAGHYADSGVRLATLTEPTRLTWRGGKRMICHYQCNGCGHAWRRADLWTAGCAGFHPKQPKAA